MFSVSCSRYCLDAIAESGWNLGRRSVQQRLGVCDGHYGLSEDRDGRVSMHLSDGSIAGESEIAPALVSEFRQRATRFIGVGRAE